MRIIQTKAPFFALRSNLNLCNVIFKGHAAPKLIHAVDVKKEGLEGKARMFPMIQY